MSISKPGPSWGELVDQLGNRGTVIVDPSRPIVQLNLIEPVNFPPGKQLSEELTFWDSQYQDALQIHDDRRQDEAAKGQHLVLLPKDEKREFWRSRVQTEANPDLAKRLKKVEVSKALRTLLDDIKRSVSDAKLEFESLVKKAKPKPSDVPVPVKFPSSADFEPLLLRSDRSSYTEEASAVKGAFAKAFRPGWLPGVAVGGGYILEYLYRPGSGIPETMPLRIGRVKGVA